MPRRSSKATIAEVAQRAGVSPATVSRVFNARFVGRSDVAERVRTAAAELAYTPSHLARSLALGQTEAVAFLVPDLANPAFQTILSAMSKTAARDGYRVLVADSAESPDDEPLLASQTRRRCDAIVLCAPRMAKEKLLALADQLRPLVLINRPDPGFAVPSLSIDYRSGIARLAEHLHQLGHRRLVYLGGPPNSVSDHHRRQGLTDFERRHGDVVIDRLAAGAAIEDGLALAGTVRNSGATAALAFNDLVAIGLLNGLGRLGLTVPDDISVAGFDDIPFASFTTPPLTTASVPHAELGAAAWRRLCQTLRGQPADGDELFPTRLELRASTGPLPS
ncbi:MAG: LacI family transcriptional regulator [Propionibacteriaceae bacterium]|nr:LacI family transcriptional regulator [Propionibacteriaceae bacterium]